MAALDRTTQKLALAGGSIRGLPIVSSCRLFSGVVRIAFNDFITKRDQPCINFIYIPLINHALTFSC
jgi:hypothetical protein